MTALIFALSAGPIYAKTFKITVVTGHPPIFLFVSAIRDEFIPYVDKHLEPLGHKVIWNQAYGGTVAPIGSELEMIQMGVADMGAFGTLFEASKMPLHSVTYMVPFGTHDINIVIDVMADLQKKIPAVAQEWARHKLVYLGGNALDSYNLLTNFEVKTVADVKGHKLGTPGPVANWLKQTGGVGVEAPLPDQYNGIKLGVFDGAFQFLTAVLGMKTYEVASNVCMMDFGAQFAGGLSINKDVFDAFPPEVQAVFIEAGKHYEKQFSIAQTAKANVAVDVMKKAGAKIVYPTYEDRVAWANTLPNVAMEWAADMEKKGLPGKEVVKEYLDGLRQRGVKLPRDWDKE